MLLILSGKGLVAGESGNFLDLLSVSCMVFGHCGSMSKYQVYTVFIDVSTSALRWAVEGFFSSSPPSQIALLPLLY